MLADGKFLRNVVLKALGLFILLNLLFVLLDPMPALGKLSFYNSLLPGRERFPFGEEPQKAYNLSLYSVEAMFASHQLTDGEKPPDEFLVIVLGDSSIWGTLLEPQETLTGQLNALDLHTDDGRKMRFYNLGYPTMSLAKDLMILDEAMRYEPDLILWPLTLESFPMTKQLESPLIANNPHRVRRLVQDYAVDFSGFDNDLSEPGFMDRSIIGQRRNLADIIRLQLYGVMWASTGIDQVYPDPYEPAQRDFEIDYSFHDLEPQNFEERLLAFDFIEAGMRIAKDVPLVVINEPIMVSTGTNSEIRYNFFYPRWAYDVYRDHMVEMSADAQWAYLDYWDLVPEDRFTNSAVHLSAQGSRDFAQNLAEDLMEMIQP